MFFLTDSKISACSSEECNNRVTGKGKQEYCFHRKIKYLFQTIAVVIKFSFERYFNKK